MAKQEHESRYEHLMMQSSRFKSEIYFLYKNMNQIEALVGVAHKLKIQAAENDGTVVFIVRDNGEGISESHLKVGTTFILKMDAERLREGADYEILYSR